jgi:predicted phage terminase large subunit-like protein
MIDLPPGLDPRKQLEILDRDDAEESLYMFLKSSWRIFDSHPWIDGWAMDAIAEHLQAIVDGEIRRLIVNIPPRCAKSALCSVVLVPWTWAQKKVSHTSGPGVSFLYASFKDNLSMRDSVKCRRVIESPWFQKNWGDRFQLVSDQNTKSRFSNDKGGERLTTSIADRGATGEGGDCIILDDCNSAKEVESEAVIESTLEWFDGTMRTRLNNQKLGAFIEIQQRLGENDLTGHILSKSRGEWTFLCLPMEFEPERSFITTIGWKDPRTEPGELLWPERFGPEEVEELKKDLGEWRCTPAESPILMSDLTMKPISEIRAGDEVVGFDKRATIDGTSGGRFKLTRTNVLEVHQYFAPVVKITLDSGEIIRCTKDHRWFTKDRGPTRDMYMPATLKSSLGRVCPPTLPTLTAEEQRDAGWLSGFFDGEGTVSNCFREHYSGAARIIFYQGAGRNKPLCDKLESTLKHFGFQYTYREDERKPNKNAPCYGYRAYSLMNGGRQQLPMLQRFLHIVQPTKWRDRIVEGAYKSNFIQQRERVVKIEPDGEEPVYALTTGTGNYIVWGIASANSAGQLQQRPEPRGGGVIKKDWWKLWDRDFFPHFDFNLACLDTAYTLDRMNDPSGMIVWSVFSSDEMAGETTAQATRMIDADGRPMYTDRTYSEGSPRVMLAYAWEDRLELHQLVKKTEETCRKFKVDLLLVENKAAGISVAQELRRLFGNEKFGIQMFDPKSQDKFARLISVQHLFQEGLIYAPSEKYLWVDKVITQIGQFPRSKHDEFVDLTSMGLKYLRDTGLLTRPPEKAIQVESLKEYPGRHQPLYNC